MNVQRKRTRPYPNGWSGVGSRAASEMETSRKPWLAVSASEWAASASMAAEPLMSPPASLVTVTNKFAASAISTVFRLACAVPRERATLRELVHASGIRSPLVTVGSYPSAVACTRGEPDWGLTTQRRAATGRPYQAGGELRRAFGLISLRRLAE